MAGVAANKFTSDAACQNCHPVEFDNWQKSHHYQSMLPAGSESLLGDFDDVVFSKGQLGFKFSNSEGQHFVEIGSPDEELTRYDVHYSFGFDPLQQVLVDVGDGRLQALPIAWNVREKRWFDLYPEAGESPSDPLHWQQLPHNWNHSCADCHSTNVEKNFDTTTNQYTTTWSAVNVGCQSCHGPASQHVDWANGVASQAPNVELNAHHLSRQINAWLKTDETPTAENSDHGQIEVCARCHSRRQNVSEKNLQGHSFLDSYSPALLRQDLYHPDGQIREEVYVYGSFSQSKMFQAGVQCTDCHDAHTTAVKIEGNGLCTQCHNENGNSRFPSLKKATYDNVDHHKHVAGSAGSECVNCHMPEKIYMTIDPRRDHSLKIPRPDLSAQLGVPNACTTCHDNETPAWAAEKLVDWFGGQKPRSFATAFDGAAKGNQAVLAGLQKIILDEGEPAIVRASALDRLGRRGPISMSLARKLVFEEALLRSALPPALENSAAKIQLDILLPLLNDDVRAVRVAAAYKLSSIEEMILQSAYPTYQKALSEYVASQKVNLDTPSANFNLAILAENQGRYAKAETYYRQSLVRSAHFVAGYANLSLLLNRQGKKAEALAVLQRGSLMNADAGELFYSLGLLAAEVGKQETSLKSLAKAAELLPARARVQYNYALVMQHAGIEDGVERQLLKAYRLDRQDVEILNAVMIYYLQRQSWKKALQYAVKLESLAPQNQEIKGLVRQLQGLQN